MDAPRTDGDRGLDCEPADSYRTVVATVIVVSLALSLAGVAGTAAAIDQIATLSPERTQVETAPGETVEVDVTLRSQGGHGGEGVEAVTMLAQYDPEYLEITDIERSAWLEGEGTEVRTADAIAHDEGTAVLEQRREPAAGGTTGTGTFATLTVRVAEDAPAGTATISFDESDVELTGDWPIALADEPATVVVDGGDEPLDSFDHTDPDELDLDLEEPSAEGDPTDSDGDEPVPGFTIGLAVVAIALSGLLLAAARDGRRG